MTITTTNWRAGLAALLATGVLLLGACSDGDDDATDDEGTEDQADDNAAADSGDSGDSTDDGSGEIPTPSVNPDAPAADSDFCQGAIALMTASVDPGSTADDGGLAAVEGLEAPDEIADAWGKFITALRELQNVDPADPEASQRATDAFTDLQDDQAKIIEYLQNDCGISDGSTSPDPTTGG